MCDRVAQGPNSLRGRSPIRTGRLEVAADHVIACLRLPGWFFRAPAGLATVTAVMAVLTVCLAPTLGEDHILEIALIYLLFTLVAAGIWGYRVGLTAAVAADLLVNFFFVPPIHTLTVQEPSNVAALALFLTVALVGALMLSLLRTQAVVAEARRAQSDILLSLSRELAQADSADDAMNRLCRVAVASLGAEGCAILREDGGWHVAASAADGSQQPSRDEKALATECLRTGSVVRLGPGHRIRIRSIRGVQEARRVVILPLRAGAGAAVLRISGQLHPPPLADLDRLLAAFADEASLSLVRAALADEARQAEDLRRADEFKSILLASVSHDLRSPLTAIRAAADSLADTSVPWTDDDRATFLDVISSQTARLTETVRDLLDMSRLEAGAVKTKIEPVNLGNLAGEVAGVMAVAGRSVRIEVAPDTWVRADYGLLRRAVENLVENAARYSTPGGAITMGAERAAGDRVRFAIADEGPGIPATDLPHIFEKFYRGIQEGRTKGTGLGLAIVKGMVELCGGTISVTSSASGTHFSLDLPTVTPAS